MNKNLILILILILTFISIGTVYSASLNVYITVSDDSVLVYGSSSNYNMDSELSSYTVSQIGNPQITTEEFKEGVRNISRKYGYEDVNVYINSILSDGSLPLISRGVGTSMEPTLHNGDMILVNRTKDIHVGDIVTCNDTEHGLIVKRVGKIDGDNIYLQSDNKTKTYKLTWMGPVIWEGLHKWVTRDRIIGIVEYDLTEDVKF